MDRLDYYRRSGSFSPGEPDACWPWLGRIDKGGYGRAGTRARAHRLVYETLVAPIPPGLTLDHLCHTRDPLCIDGDDCMHRRCVNPWHLEPVTGAENTRRGRSPQGVNARKSECIHGHPFDEANTYIRPNGDRDCRICTCQRQLAYQRRKRMNSVEKAA